MFQTSHNPKIQIVSALSTMREEWQQAAQGISLLQMEANVGLILADLVHSLGLSAQEQTQVLGQELFAEMQEILSCRNVQ
jgi:hypothetical protein